MTTTTKLCDNNLLPCTAKPAVSNRKALQQQTLNRLNENAGSQDGLHGICAPFDKPATCPRCKKEGEAGTRCENDGLLLTKDGRMLRDEPRVQGEYADLSAKQINELQHAEDKQEVAHLALVE